MKRNDPHHWTITLLGKTRSKVVPFVGTLDATLDAADQEESAVAFTVIEFNIKRGQLSNAKNVRASKARSAWSLVGGLSRRPVPGDVLKCVRTHKKCIVWAVSKHGVHHVPYAEKDPLYSHGTIMPWGLGCYTWVETVAKYQPANAAHEPRDDAART